MRKKLMIGLLVLIGLSGFAVFGNSPGVLGRIVDSVHSGIMTKLFSSENDGWQIVAKAGYTKRSSRKELTVPGKAPESMLWHIAFDFTRKIESKSAQLNGRGQDGGLYSRYFIRQGPLSENNDQILNQLAIRYFEEVGPLEQRAKALIENAKNNSAALAASSPELRELQAQRDAIALRTRDAVKGSFGEKEFDIFASFLKTEFSNSATSGMIPAGTASSPSSPQGIFYNGYSWIISATYPFISGISTWTIRQPTARLISTARPGTTIVTMALECL